ncbi:MAG: dynamin family protein [Armatimonadetes bacterium]|nr:dynamin family protein [Armatimonadota bacterium]
MTPEELLRWFHDHVRPLVNEVFPQRLPILDDDARRLDRLLEQDDRIEICFLGNCAVGKSTLLNALVVGDGAVVPSGGKGGPLTALATEVRYSERKHFVAHYHPPAVLNKISFALERQLERELKGGQPADRSLGVGEDIGAGLEPADREEVLAELDDAIEGDATDGEVSSRLDHYRRQAQLLIAGTQDGDLPLDYLVDCLRLALGQKPREREEPSEDALARIRKTQGVLARARDGQPYERFEFESGDARGFNEDLEAHVAGFLSPLIERLAVGWPSELLSQGVVLVDLPGVGISRDVYRRVTQEHIANARAVVLVVNRAGMPEGVWELLRQSGYLQRLVGTADDPGADPCAMMVVVTHVDDTTRDEWSKRIAWGEKPKKADLFRETVAETQKSIRQQFIAQVRDAVAGETGEIGDTVNAVADHLMTSVQVHPVSAPEYRRLRAGDEDDPPFLKDPGDSGIPALRCAIQALAEDQRQALRARRAAVSERLERGATHELNGIAALSINVTQSAEQAARLRRALELVVEQKKKEYLARRGGFREYLDAAARTRIRELVIIARDDAKWRVAGYLRELRYMHWGSLRAAVRRGGVWLRGSGRNIDVPNDIVDHFHIPMAAVWSEGLLKEIRERTRRLADDTASMVREICDRAREYAAADIDPTRVDAEQQRSADQAKQFGEVGTEAADELRKEIRKGLADVIEPSIRSACDEFVRRGDHIGSGVKNRMLNLFEELAAEATEAAVEPAVALLRDRFESVREDILRRFGDWGDPLQQAVDGIAPDPGSFDTERAVGWQEILHRIWLARPDTTDAEKADSESAGVIA